MFIRTMPAVASISVLTARQSTPPVASAAAPAAAGVAFANGLLDVMAIEKVLRYDGIATNPSIQPIDVAAAAAWR